MNISRRDAGWLITRAAATAAGQSFLPSWLAAESGRTYQPQFFSAQEFATLDTFTTLLIPTDETPGAREAKVAEFIDFIVFSAAEFAPETQPKWHRAIGWLGEQKVQGVELMKEISQPGHAGFPTFQFIKEMAVYAFYTSRAGLIDNLEYKGLAYLTEFPACTHPEHHQL